MNIILHTNALTRRGDSITVGHYAKALQTFYYFNCIIAYDLKSANNDDAVISLMNNEFNLFGYQNFSELEKFALENNTNIVYWVKSGQFDNKIIKTCKNVIHVVFNVISPHGDVYAYVSKWLAKEASSNYTKRFKSSKSLIKKLFLAPNFENTNLIIKHFTKKINPDDYVPHIVELPEPNEGNFRKKYGFDSNSFIIGRIGGYDQFNIDFVKKWIEKIIELYKDTHFVLINTERFIDHSRVVFINEYISEQEKSNFIKDCDMMLHAREMGESFGLAIAESLFNNTPIASYYYGKDGNHREMLRNTGLLFKNEKELTQIFEQAREGKFNEYDFTQIVQEFSPKEVVKKFVNIFVTNGEK